MLYQTFLVGWNTKVRQILTYYFSFKGIHMKVIFSLTWQFAKNNRKWWTSALRIQFCFLWRLFAHTKTRQTSFIICNCTWFSGQKEHIRGLSIAELLPASSEFMTYEGSLTYPGCQETVTWIIPNQPFHVSQKDVQSKPLLSRQLTRTTE